MKRQRYAYPRRDPPEKKKRPYERYAAKKMSKLALRRLALQAIGRPGVAQGPLHDTLFEMYPDGYERAIKVAETDARIHQKPKAVVFLVGRHTKARLTATFLGLPFVIFTWVDRLEERLNDIANPYFDLGAGPYVVTYITRAPR